MPLARFRRALAAAAVVALLAPVAAHAQGAGCDGQPTGVKIVVKVENVRDSQGLMAATFYNDASKFLKKGGSIRVMREPSRAPGQSLCFWAPGPGDYAVVVYQDRDSNHKFAFNLFTGPKEPWGLTHNPPNMSLLHWPTFDQVKFTAHPGENVVTISLNYPK
ncbi:DUF2141 domain-containing protein [Caulobacter sp. KR2-114]|uniref:DUF2141 domain-containing protein n=1 Tax=Caulobacter sp. KR2-114 TaxID=3400912 RepID=UPI003C060E08